MFGAWIGPGSLVDVLQLIGCIRDEKTILGTQRKQAMSVHVHIAHPMPADNILPRHAVAPHSGVGYNVSSQL